MMQQPMSPNQYADYWYYTAGVNVIPANNAHEDKDLRKKPFWTNSEGKQVWISWSKEGYQTESITEEQFQYWKACDAFRNGMAIICGKVFRGEHKGEWLNGIDCDNKAGTEAMNPSGIEVTAKRTLVEQHANPDKCHILFYTREPLKPRSAVAGAEVQIEVKSAGKNILYCAGGRHQDGSLIDVVDTFEIKLEKDHQRFEKMLDEVLGTQIKLKTPSAKVTDEELSKLKEGDNRQIHILQRLGVYFATIPQDAITEDDCIHKAKWLNSKCGTPYPESRAEQIGRHFYNYRMNDDETEIEKLNEKTNTVDSKTFTNDHWSDVCPVIQNNIHILTLRDTKQKDMYYYDEKEHVYLPHGDTRINEEAQRLIKGCTNRTRSEIRETIRHNGTMIYSKDLFDSGVINTQNCILDPKTFDKIDHSWKYLSVTKLPFAVDFKSRNLKIWNLILDIIHAKDIKIIMEIIWGLIIGKNPYKKLIVLMGKPNTRKTTLEEIISWIIGMNNFSKEKPIKFLGKNNAYSTSQFVGKRGNLSEEIGNLTKEMIENQKALVGGIVQDTEKKHQQTRQPFDPKKFLFIYSTNTLGENFSQLADDISIVTRFEIIACDKVVPQMNGEWESTFFVNDEDKQSAINTIVNIVIHYKKAQSFGMVPNTEWSNPAKTKSILQAQKPKEESYFDRQRIVPKDGGKLYLSDIKKDFEAYVGYTVSSEQSMGNILKNHGMKSKRTNGKTWYSGYALGSQSGNSTLG
ncbi:MAG: hypothetical protein HOB51_05265 [Thaumarchaeota archaeon]|nr:hypothetical protein [Nitrososphaerota archaeon]